MQINTPFNDKEQEYNSQPWLNGKTEQQEDFFDRDRKVTLKDVLILGGITAVICIIIALI